MLVLQNMPMSEEVVQGLSINLLETESNAAKFDLTLNLIESKEGLRGSFEYSTELFEASTIERLAGYFIHLLQAIVADPGCAVGKLPMLGEAASYFW